MEESDVVEIPPPVNWGSKTMSLKRKEDFCPEIICVEDYEDCPYSFFDSGKSDARFKGKQIFADYSLNSTTGTHDNATGNDVKFTGKSYEGSHYSNEAYKEIVYVDDDDDDDDYIPEMDDDQFALLLDNIDIPPEIDLSIPRVTDNHVSNKNLFTGSGSAKSAYQIQHQNDPRGFSSWNNKSYPMPWHSKTEHVEAKYTSGDSSNSHIQFDSKKMKPSDMVDLASSYYSGKASRKTEFPQAYGLHAAKYCGKKLLAPCENLLNKQISLAATNFDKASMPTANTKPLLPHEALHSLKNQTFTDANNFPKASMPTANTKPLLLHETPHSLKKKIFTAKHNFPYATIHNDNGSLYNLGPNNVDLSHKFTGHYSIAKNLPTAYSSGMLDSSGPLFPTFSDPTAFINPLFSNSMEIPNDLKAVGKFSRPSGPSCSKSVVNVDPEIILKKFDLFKKFDTVEDYSDHSFSKSNAFAATQPPKNWAKKIQDEWRILEKDLPDKIFVRVYDSRMDLLRAVIIGAEGTPYNNGLFFFDMFFPSTYPHVPPKVKYHSGGLRINPNLYACGKVCLSLLNTWGGSGNEKWVPGESTVLQILVSIQGLILNEKPYFNEPGYANMGGTVRGEKSSLDYNEKTFIYSLKTMVYSIKNPPKHFEDLVVGQFFNRAHDILAECRAYKKGAQVGSVVVKGGDENANNTGEKTNSHSFKTELTGYLKILADAFTQVGVKDCDKFLSCSTLPLPLPFAFAFAL